MWGQHLRTGRKSKKTQKREIDIWRVRAIFHNFRRILQLNTSIFETMAELERSLGGEYIFDSNYLESAVRDIASNVHHVTYNLNALTNNRYIPIYDRYQEIRIILDDILAGNYKDLYCPPILPLNTLDWELEPLVGIQLVCLAELQHHPGIKPAEGFAVTGGAVRALLHEDPDASTWGAVLDSDTVKADILESLLPKQGDNRFPNLAISASQIDEEMEDTRCLGNFLLKVAKDGKSVILEEIVRTGSEKIASPQEVSADVEIIPEHVFPGNDYASLLLKGVQKSAAIAQDRLHTTREHSSPSLSLFIRQQHDIVCQGSVTTRARTIGSVPLLSITAFTAANDQPDFYYPRRLYPFDLIVSEISTKSPEHQFPAGKTSTDQLEEGKLLRGSSHIDHNTLQSLAETAMLLERFMGVPVRMHWEMQKNGNLIITQLFPFLEKTEEPTAAELSEEMDSATLLAEGGRVVQSGVAAGVVVHVDEYTNPEDFPLGAIAVAPFATPQLTPILHRTAALLTEQGNPVGHLGTVARELSLPSLFGIPNVRQILPPGEEVTVDVSMRCVFKGILKTLLHLGNREMTLSPVNAEYRTLRRMLRFIAPLNVVDPEAPNFTAADCRTFHDIIHFCHEMAVEELAHFQERRPELSGINTSSLTIHKALTINLLDIGNGIAPTSSPPTVTDILSKPFAVFLDGLMHPLAPGDALPSMGIRDIISSLPKTGSATTGHARETGSNLAIIGPDYMNLSLRLGYHFSVIDAHLSSDPHRNYIYFRFIGGFADLTRRKRRARFIEHVLATMDFKVECKADLVVGRMKFEQKETLRSALFVLGALTTFSRQRDIAMEDDSMQEELFRNFADTFLLSFGSRSSVAHASEPLSGRRTDEEHHSR